MKKFRVVSNEIYEDTGNPRKDRLIWRLTISGEWVTGPGLGDEHDTLTQAVPEQLKYLAASNVFLELRN
jgi:hypothetical protein